MTQAAKATAVPEFAPATAWSRPSLVALALIVGTAVLLGWTARVAALNVNGDDAINLTLSTSLGQGEYRDAYLVGTPAHAQYPPGLPAWLLLVRLVSGGSLDALLAGNFLLISGMVCLLADAVRRLSTPSLGVAVAAVVALNPGVLALGGELRSEPLYFACCALALWCTVDLEREGRGWCPTVAFVAAIAAFLTRSAGIVLLPAIGIALLVQRRWRPLVLGGMSFLLVIGAWFAYTRWATQHTIGHTYALDLVGAAPLGEPLRFLGHIFRNAREYFAYLAAVQFSIPDIHDFPIDNGVWGLLLIIPAVVGAWRLAHRWPAVVAFLLLSTGILLVYPWAIGRLLTGLLPWLVVLVLFGWAWIASVTRIDRGRQAALVIATLLAALGTAAQVPRSVLGLRCRASAPFTNPRCDTVADRSYFAAAVFIRDSLPKGAVIAASKPSSIYYNSGRLTIPLELFGRNADALLLAPRGPATHLLLSRKFPYEGRLVAPWLRERCASLALVAPFPGETLLLGPRTATSGDACAALDEYVRSTPQDSGDDTR